MYESFYGFREKPFTLLPDAGFLYLSSKHKMALTLLEYGLMSQAGFSVISGDIGTGKTTLIRKLLNQIDNDVRVGLISNTHQSFGELMQWIALAFELPHTGKDKVQLYQMFVDFIISEYAQGRRTVLIVDEAQNMSAETLEELRMLSNINADKDQVLQIILVGQRELRDTLRRPDLIQFAQRIAVDYHLEPLSASETHEYIQHRCRVAGGKPDLFSDQACAAVFELTGGVPRLINTLCDTVLVYGYAEQRERIDAMLVHDVGHDKQQGGLFAANTPEPEKKNLRIAVAAESSISRQYIARLLSYCGFDEPVTLSLEQDSFNALDPASIDILLIELTNNPADGSNEFDFLGKLDKPVLFCDSHTTRINLASNDQLAYGQELSEKLLALVPGNINAA